MAITIRSPMDRALPILLTRLALALVVLPLAAAAGAGAAPPTGAAGEAPGASVLVPAASEKAALDEPPALDLASLEPLARLDAAAETAAERLEELRAWNRAGRLPMRIGFARPLSRPHSVEVDARGLGSAGAFLPSGALLTVEPERVVWAATLEVEAAHALRVRLRVDELPAGTRIWTRGEDGVARGPYGAELLGADGSFWLPPVAGSRVSVEIAVPRASLASGEALRLRLEEITELLDPLGAIGAPVEASIAPKAATPCEIDGRCVGVGTLSVIDDYRHAVARLVFEFGGFTALCSGSLVNDTVEGSQIPYLLTANHCFSTQAQADSLVAYFDYFPATCNGTPPPLPSLPQVAGSTLLATGEESDFTLVELNALPPGYNYLLGWTTRDLLEGETLHMLSHPEGRRQAFSTSGYTEFPNRFCGNFSGLFYAEQLSGSTLGGSSGAPVIVDEAGGQVVGQLLGACETSSPDYCDYNDFTEVDGAFQVTYPAVAPWLDPGQPTLTITTLDGSAAEPSDLGAFRISRTLDLSTNAQVTVATGGSATSGADYQPIASPVTIPAGQGSVDVPVTPLDDPAEEPDETIVLTLVSSPGYAIGEPSSATVTLADDEGPDCRSVLVADQDLAAGNPAACDRLHAGPDLTISAGGDVALSGGRSVVLYHGFSVGAGATVRISTCGHNLCAAGSQPSTAGCHPCVDQICAVDSFCCTTAWDGLCVDQVESVCGLTCP